VKSYKKYTSIVIDFIIISIFLDSLIDKISNFSVFQLQFSRILIIQENNLWWLSYFVPTAELSIIILILFKREYGYLLCFFTMIIFTSFLINKYIGSELNQCSCGGIFEFMTLGQHIIVNFIIIFISYSIFTIYKSRLG